MDPLTGRNWIAGGPIQIYTLIERLQNIVESKAAAIGRLVTVAACGGCANLIRFPLCCESYNTSSLCNGASAQNREPATPS